MGSGFTNPSYTPCRLAAQTGKPSDIDRIKSYRLPQDKTYLLFRHFGIDGSPTTNYNEWFRTRSTFSPNNYYGNIRRALGLKTSAVDGVAWFVDTRQFPERMRVEIPGAGVHVQFGKVVKLRNSKVFSSNSSRLNVQLKFKAHRYDAIAGGKANLTIGVSLHILNTEGGYFPLTLNTSLVNMEGVNAVEGAASDLRNVYARTNLSPHSTFITHKEGSKFGSSFSDFRDFEFEINAQNIANLIAVVNERLERESLPLLVNDMANMRLRNINLKNEFTHLDSGGDAVINFRIKEFKASVITP